MDDSAEAEELFVGHLRLKTRELMDDSAEAEELFVGYLRPKTEGIDG